MARSAVVIVENGSVALIKRVHAGQTYYVFPGGIERGETPEMAVRREAKEEVGLDVRVERGVSMVRRHPE